MALTCTSCVARFVRTAHTLRTRHLVLSLWLAWLAGPMFSSARAQPNPIDIRSPTIAPHMLVVLSETQRALVEARDLAAKLDEHAALARLLTAERSLREILHVPGVHGWLAEVWLQMGLVAAQSGELALADSFFAQALTLDPTRHVGAAEAAPPVIARSEAAARARDAAQRSRFRIEPTPTHATCWIDGRLRGAGATEIDVAPGPHLLLIEAPGHRSYATLLDALSGTRRPITIVLAPAPDSQSQSQRDVGDAAFHPPTVGVLVARSDHVLAAPSRKNAQKQRWWKRWSVWVSAASVAVAGGVVIGFATRDERSAERRTLSIDPGATKP